MEQSARQDAVRLYDQFTHGGLERRAFTAQMVRIAGSVAAAEALVAAIAASPAAAAVVPENDRRIRTGTTGLLGNAGHPLYSAYVAEPRSKSAVSTVIVIHENRGLNAHIKDVARRLAVAGHYALAPDFLSPSGGTPANEDEARNAIAALDLDRAVGAGVAMLKLLSKRSGGNGKVGAIGFCWGGGYVNRLAVTGGKALDAAAVFYGPAPDPAEAARVEAPLLIHHAGLDDRIARTLWPWVHALRAAEKPVTYFDYPNVNHAFHNDTSSERYDSVAAALAWKRTLRFLARHLAA